MKKVKPGLYFFLNWYEIILIVISIESSGILHALSG